MKIRSADVPVGIAVRMTALQTECYFRSGGSRSYGDLHHLFCRGAAYLDTRNGFLA